MIVPLILSGGSGTRLWPLSRELYPKQFHALVGETTLLQETVSRLAGLPQLDAPIVLCNEAHRFMVAEQLREIGVEKTAIYLEPHARNTAPAVAIGALAALARGGDPVLLVLPADHVIVAREEFHAAVAGALPWVEQGRLATFGIVPGAAETGFGYIQRGAALADGSAAYAVERFVEKPAAAQAQEYVASGRYLWNSGMFLFRASRYLAELERFAPEILACCRAAFAQRRTDFDFERIDAAAFQACPNISIDYAVMEKVHDAIVVPLDAGWSDVGSWSALWHLGARDHEGNVKIGDVLTADVQDSYLASQGRLVAAVGLDNLIVIETADAVLVAAKDRAQDVKEVVALLKTAGRGETQLHKKVFRPWGSYESFAQDGRFQVKRLTIKPGAQLSLQLHNRRAEHWVVVRGAAVVTRDDEVFTLSEDQSTYIPVGTRHRLENRGDVPLEIIEVQTGGYLGEDDIVRLEDSYGRV